jgi:hypothetical protein
MYYYLYFIYAFLFIIYRVYEGLFLLNLRSEFIISEGT